jgi:phospholipid/cholesterol/gamma-HCH transport system substrate-binding protein
MDRDRRLSLTVGGFVLAALAALAVGILSLSAEQGVFQPRYRLVAYFDNVQGLVSGAAVRLAGTRVGQVQRVELATRQDGTPAVRVQMQIDDAVRERIRADSVAHITTVGLLGDQIVEISIGTTSSPVLGEGDVIEALDPFDLNVMVSKGGRALEQIEVLAGRLDDTLAEFQSSGGAARLSDSLVSLSELIQEVRTGDGVLHTLIYEPYQGTAVASLETSLESLANIMTEVERGDGILHSLVYEEPTEQDMVMQFLEAGARLNSILTKIDAGEGTLGLLLNDPTLYEELKRLVGGAGRSTVVRSLIDMVAPAEDP